ncbi:hypothetical protein Slin_6409 [Spirosoma linguale DSM 74]|uniref:Uncharacterized protein n=1 Tax=Spirosoma linguale (strain ATCC 33905 / DSM 74 / LMG 10896 / Claus 1) TaxID=504472 RepID=D2QU85_SPILD|nr:hypothetical protein Slin_6409 [Spirosoma linguale DSM 74]
MTKIFTYLDDFTATLLAKDEPLVTDFELARAILHQKETSFITD